jgi:lipopolysaccharide assembly outer membrane protein LptD (OstA)
MALYKPDFPYLGEQIIINSGRVTLNSKDDSIFLFAKKAIGFSSVGNIHFDSDGDTIMNSNKIYLGLDANEPLIKGTQLVNLLNRLLESLNNFSQVIQSATDSNNISILAAATAGDTLAKDITKIKSLINTITSKQNFTK